MACPPRRDESEFSGGSFNIQGTVDSDMASMEAAKGWWSPTVTITAKLLQLILIIIDDVLGNKMLRNSNVVKKNRLPQILILESEHQIQFKRNGYHWKIALKRTVLSILVMTCLASLQFSPPNFGIFFFYCAKICIT